MPRDHLSAISIIVTHCVPARAQYLNGNSSYRYMYVYDIPFDDFIVFCITKAKMLTDSEAIGAIFILLKVFLSRVMRCQEDAIPVLGTRTAVPFILYNRAVLTHKTTTKLFIFVFSFDLYYKLNDPIVWSLVRSACSNDIHSRVKSVWKV